MIIFLMMQGYLTMNFRTFLSSTRKLKGNSYYKYFHAYLGELKSVLGWFFLLHNFVPTNIILIQMLDQAEILLKVFRGLVLYQVKILDHLDITKALWIRFKSYYARFVLVS
jgi:hypothetical protein